MNRLHLTRHFSRGEGPWHFREGSVGSGVNVVAPLNSLLTERRIMKNALVILICVLVVSSCGFNAPPKGSKVVELPSGKKVRVYSIQKIVFGDKSHEPSLLLRYETNLEIMDSPQLRKEVLDVWELLRPIADKSGDVYAMVKANEPIRGIVTKTMGFTYGFDKNENGTWSMKEPKK